MINNIKNTIEYNSRLKEKGYSVYALNSSSSGHEYSRKNFYKISLTSGHYIFHYQDRSFEIDQTTLFFGTPRIPYSCEVIRQTESGFACLFTEEFLQLGERSESLLQSPLFKIGGTPVLSLSATQSEELSFIYSMMLKDQDLAHPYKEELIRNYISLIIHQGMKINPLEIEIKKGNAAQRITSVFLDLLERQFPIDNNVNPLQLKTAQDYANDLAIHVNHLNNSVKEITGKSTSQHIADRVVNEAKALLHHTNWNIGEIAYALGFDSQNYFNNFFKKKTGESPTTIRAGFIALLTSAAN